MKFFLKFCFIGMCLFPSVVQAQLIINLIRAIFLIENRKAKRYKEINYWQNFKSLKG
jgi:hypothetical protein